MLKPSIITDLLDTYASDADGESEDEVEVIPSDEEVFFLDVPPGQAPLEGDGEDASEEEDDDDELAVATKCAGDVEKCKHHIFTVGPTGETTTKVHKDGQWVDVSVTTPLDAKLQLPPRPGTKVQQHKHTAAGNHKWQAWYPGAQPASRHITGPNAREDVLKWAWEQHEQWEIRKKT